MFTQFGKQHENFVKLYGVFEVRPYDIHDRLQIMISLYKPIKLTLF